LPLDDLRRSVRRSSTNGFSEFAQMGCAAESKIYEFHVPMFIKHDILRLDIPMT
jgi:hypothetical protein